MVHSYFITTVFISINIWRIHGQESALNTTKTTSVTSIKPITNYSYQIPGFNSSAVTSGPILLIDKKTVFISNLHYNGSDSSALFWAGKGEPSSSGTAVPDEEHLINILKVYHGQNIYLQMPDNLTLDKIDYLAIWSRDRNLAIGHVKLYSNDSDDVRGKIPEAGGFHRTTEDEKTIFRIPKCCEFNQMYNETRCSPSTSEPNLEYNVYASNETHIDPDASLHNITFIPYVYKLKCPSENYLQFILDKKDDTFGLIFNSSLIIAGIVNGILLHGEFCLENYIGRKEPRFAICYKLEEEDITGASVMPNLYFPFLIISTICFFLSALCYIFILKAKDVHKQCFIGYSSSMTVTFLSLIFLQQLSSGCKFIGSLFIFSTLCSFVWLTCLCTDLLFSVKSYERYSDRIRIYFYIGASVIIPIIFLMVSLIPEGSPDVPSSFVKMYSQDICKFKDANIAILFTPIGFLILASLFALGYTSYIINTHNDTHDYDWVRNKSQFKFMLRSCFLIWITTCVWLLEVIVHILGLDKIGLQFAIDLIEASQGIFVAFIFVLNKYTRREILRVLEREKHRQEREMQLSQLLSTLNQTNETNGVATGARAENEHG